MVAKPPQPTSPLQPALAEKRVTLQVDWDAFQTILSALPETRSTRLSYYHGQLEIMTPLEPHENSSGLIGQFVEIVTEELDLPIKTMESTTLKRSGLEIGGEPDQSYYITNEPWVRGRQVDLTRDPPPDLVIAVDITHTDINKNALYAALGISEFWRYNGQTLTIYHLQNGQYQEVPTGSTFPQVPKEQLYRFLGNCIQQGETAAKRTLRAWIQENIV